MLDISHIEAAATRIAPYVIRTGLERSHILSDDLGQNVLLKMEHRQPTGSFKIRGATNKILTLPRRALDEGVVTASTGNHGAGVARATGILGGRSTVFVPENASDQKVTAIRNLGADIRRAGHDAVQSESAAREYASENDLAYVPPYNDEMVIAGQGTVGREMVEQAQDLAAVYVPVGGGGLISGIAAYVKSAAPNTEVIACSAERSGVMHHSVAAGKVLDLESHPTISDGTSGGIETGTLTFEICRRLVDRWLLVPEPEIVNALRLALMRLHLRIEGAAALALAGLLLDHERFPGLRVAVVLSGGNISQDALRRIFDLENSDSLPE